MHQLVLENPLQRLKAVLRKTIVFVTHDTAEALLVADRIAVLDAGHLQGVFTPREFLASDNPAVRPYLAALRAAQGLGV